MYLSYHSRVARVSKIKKPPLNWGGGVPGWVQRNRRIGPPGVGARTSLSLLHSGVPFYGVSSQVPTKVCQNDFPLERSAQTKQRIQGLNRTTRTNTTIKWCELATTYSPCQRQVPSALVGLTSVFGMRTGVAPPLSHQIAPFDRTQNHTHIHTTDRCDPQAPCARESTN